MDGRSGVMEADINGSPFSSAPTRPAATCFAHPDLGRISLMIGLAGDRASRCDRRDSMARRAGYLGGRVDLVMMRVVDILYSLPFIFFVILLVVFFGRNIVLMFIAVGAVEWLDMARIVRGQTLS
jgi:oligopeptide transport system permease protein